MGWVLQAGKWGVWARSQCWLLCPRGHFCAWRDTPLSQPPQLFSHLPPEDPTAFPYHRRRVQRTGLLLPLPWLSTLHRQHWKNNWLNDKRWPQKHSEERYSGSPSGRRTLVNFSDFIENTRDNLFAVTGIVSILTAVPLGIFTLLH